MTESSLDDDLVQRARRLCETAHAVQQRDSGQPYATHPAAVVRLLHDRGKTDPVVLAAAWLHDVLEDTDIAASDLRKEFGDEVADLVSQLTNIGPPARSPEQKQTALLAHARRMSAPAKLIKMADRLHNLTDMGVWPESKRRRYAAASLELLEALRPWPDHELAADLRATALSHLGRIGEG